MKRLFWLIFLIIPFFLINFCTNASTEAKNGILDLNSIHFNNFRLVTLSGEWIYFPEKISTPENLNYHAEISPLLYKSADWKEPIWNSSSKASYQMILRVPESDENLFINIHSPFKNYTLFISDAFSIDKEVTGQKKAIFHPVSSGEVRITFNIENHNFWNPFPLGSIQIGTEKELLLFENIVFTINIFTIILSAVLIAYNPRKIIYYPGLLGILFLASYSVKNLLDDETTQLFVYIDGLSKIFIIGTFTLVPFSFKKFKNYIFKTFIAVISLALSSVLFLYFIPYFFYRIESFFLLLSLSYLSVAIVYNRKLELVKPEEIEISNLKEKLDTINGDLVKYKQSYEKSLIDKSYNMLTYMEKLDIQNIEIEKLNELLVLLLAESKMNEILDKVFSHIMTYYRADIAFIYFVDQETNEFYPYRGMTKNIPEEIKNFMEKSRMPISKDAGVSFIAHKRKRTIYIDKAKTKYTRYRESSKDNMVPERLSSLYVPILIKNESHGVFFLATMNHSLNLTQEKLKYLSMFTNQIAAIIQKENLLHAMEEEKKRAEIEKDRAERAKKEIEAINDLTRSINENLELKVIMEKVINFVKKNYNISHYTLHLINQNKTKMKFLAGKFPKTLQAFDEVYIKQTEVSLSNPSGVFSFIYNSNKMVFYKKLNYSNASPEEIKIFSSLHIDSFVGIPLKVKNEIIGLLSFYSSESLNLSRLNLRTLANLGEQVAGIIHNSNLYKQVQSEKDKSDSLLLSILPPQIAEELKNTNKVVPVIYDSVSILFTDFVGFTKIAEKLLPRQLLVSLDGFFTFFDFISEKYGLEKLKTIGDSYMCAGGLPTINKTHPIDACLAAMEFKDFSLRMQELAQNSREVTIPWELRIGIHTGPVIGGVVGTTKFAYDVWGDSVNTASRIESSGKPGKINISGDTYKLIKDLFDCEYRGKIMAKNKGSIDMYFLDRIKPELSIDGEGVLPNDRFHEIYESIKTGKSLVLV